MVLSLESPALVCVAKLSVGSHRISVMLSPFDSEVNLENNNPSSDPSQET